MGWGGAVTFLDTICIFRAHPRTHTLFLPFSFLIGKQTHPWSLSTSQGKARKVPWESFWKACGLFRSNSHLSGS